MTENDEKGTPKKMGDGGCKITNKQKKSGMFWKVSSYVY